ncbi:uncharacterized protein RCC_02339 [Ramularia collo-cygni]|uniref:Uncharacterized protein n=1 Tax=Ramularia collo-cygni TaxID=112498 RepID=A0A2D3UZ47_9PEZI|nr:uncharacterized protein RCC_02339 [Ramularia collo-cygni]CZT16496.1 uncharacterized protein RCC_02339 [Ramularia collo-cygni]
MAFGSPVRCSETKISPRNTHPPVLTRQERSFEAFDNYDESLSPSGSSALAQGLVYEDSCTVVLQNVLGYESLYKEIRIIKHQLANPDQAMLSMSDGRDPRLALTHQMQPQ